MILPLIIIMTSRDWKKKEKGEKKEKGRRRSSGERKERKRKGEARAERKREGGKVTLPSSMDKEGEKPVRIEGRR